MREREKDRERNRGRKIKREIGVGEKERQEVEERKRERERERERTKKLVFLTFAMILGLLSESILSGFGQESAPDKSPLCGLLSELIKLKLRRYSDRMIKIILWTSARENDTFTPEPI